MSNELRNFLALTYEQLEEFNLAAKADRTNRVAVGEIREKRLKYLTDEKRIKAVTVLFSDLEGRLHLLDYDKKFLLGSYENLTFDGSSIRGFTAQKESDLRLGIDWAAFYWVPADVFGNGKMVVFGNVIDKDGTPYSGDMRGVLKNYSDKLFAEKGYTLNSASEIEGFLFAGKDAEQRYHETGKFEFISTGGYYHSLPLDPLRQFIDTSAEVQRAMGFQNEKDHPEVAPSQFEINYCYSEAVAAADQIQLYKLLTRQIASNMGYTACSTIAQTLGLVFKRIQFTPDLMPSDITGTDIIEEDPTTGHRRWTFVPGPIFANILLADEINRTPPKTQSALLEAMQELSCTVRGTSLQIAGAVLRAGHAKPDRAGRHLPAARSAARPLPVQHRARLPERRRRSESRRPDHHHARGAGATR